MENTKRYGMVIDLRKCVGCHACTIACKMENATPASCFNTWVEEWDVGEYPNVSRAKLPKLCNHCTDAPCVPVCPVEATYAVDGGMVVVDKEKCIGCGLCMTACPYDARYMGADQKVGKCTLCIQRVNAGLAPECVSTCISHSRYFGDLNDPNSEVAKMMKENNCQGLQEELGLGLSVVYIGLEELLQKGVPEVVFKGGK